MFPTDPNIGCTNITDSVATTRRARFCKDVVEWDGVHLVGKGAVLLRRCAPPGPSQGRLGMLLLLSIYPCSPSQRWQYISTYTQHRSRDPIETDIVEDIDNVRNGLLLHNSIHRALGEHVAFLMVCDACMMSIRSLMVLVSRCLTLP